MPNGGERAQERDTALVRGLCQIARNTRTEFGEWIQAEIKELRIKAQMIEAASSGEVQRKAKSDLESIRDIDLYMLPEITRQYKTRPDEMYEGTYTDPFDAFVYLEECSYRMVMLAMRIFRLCRVLDALIESGDVDDEGDLESEG